MAFLNLDGKTVFVTGGTGTIGSEVVSRLLEEGCHVVVYSRDQNKQFKMDHITSSKRVSYKNGDICDYALLSRSMVGSDYIIHCGASKHLPLCENNVDSAIKVNVEGTRNVLVSAMAVGVKKTLLLSTDKAVDPTSVMGCTKFLAERLFLEFSKIIPCSIVRLGNVFASNGSVVPTFEDKMRHKLPIVINDIRAERYFISKKEVGKFIVNRLKDMTSGEVFIKKMKIMKITDLAECMVPVGYPIHYGQALDGEKLSEKLFSEDESFKIKDMGDYLKIGSEKQLVKYSFEDKLFNKEEIIKLLKGLI